MIYRRSYNIGINDSTAHIVYKKNNNKNPIQFKNNFNNYHYL